MSPTWGVHTGLQNTSVGELTALWHHIEDLGFDWISIWDHFYSADLTGPHCLEAVAAHTALALSTTQVRCGSLVYCAGYRHPAVLANAMATIDHLSDGRVEFGIGAGWANVPALNLLMGAPLKIAAGTSSVVLSLVDSSAAWVYLNKGAVLPMIAVPSVVGMMLGARIGARLLHVLKGSVVRRLVIAVLLFAGARALLKGLGVWP